MSTDVSARTHALLPPEEGPTEANAVAVLSRADEIGVARLDALQTAERIARRCRTDPKLRRLCQTVVPVAGLLAEAGATLRRDEYGALQAPLAVPREEFASRVLSAERFVSSNQEPPIDAEARYLLRQRLGSFGVRLSLGLLRHSGVGSAPELAIALTKHSGIDQLREVLAARFAARADLLEARSALATSTSQAVRRSPSRTTGTRSSVPGVTSPAARSPTRARIASRQDTPAAATAQRASNVATTAPASSTASAAEDSWRRCACTICATRASAVGVSGVSTSTCKNRATPPVRWSSSPGTTAVPCRRWTGG